jgi:hypothetical protein
LSYTPAGQETLLGLDLNEFKTMQTRFQEELVNPGL